MECKVNLSNSDKIKEVVAQVEGKASKRCFDHNKLMPVMVKAEKQLQALGIAKKNWKGCTVIFSSEGVPNNYKHSAEGTYLVVKRFASAWFVVEVYRGYVSHKPYGGTTEEKLYLSQVAKENIPDRYTL